MFGSGLLSSLFGGRRAAKAAAAPLWAPAAIPSEIKRIGLIAGNGSFPLRFAEGAKQRGCSVVAVCHQGETDPRIEEFADVVQWIKLGQLGKLVSTFLENNIEYAAMAGGINRIRAFGVKLDARGVALLARLRSAKDDVIMRGIADELEGEGIKVVDSTIFMHDHLAPLGVLTRRSPSAEELEDVRVGTAAIAAMSSQDIGQVVVVKEGVVVAVEAIEGTDRTISRAGELCGSGCVVVKFAKTTQDMRFDVPTVGIGTIETMVRAGASVLAVEAGRCIIMDRDEVIRAADSHRICILGSEPLAAKGGGAPSEGEVG